ncbi:MAG: polyprenol monophosphomannose synthase [Candidatus Aureabacteria bacterium]|nr:polyprenol monophosphomannose synthase [Candidatus Auribacterota bacterium]
MNKSIVLIGTYNEQENLAALVGEILALNAGLDILVIDDNSPDGTGRLADELAAAHPEVTVLHRPGKMGLGTAYVAGFRRALEHGYDRIVTMDADFSHEPGRLPGFLAAFATHDVVVGTRYMKGGGVVNWPPHRLILSRGGSIYTRLVTGMPLRDATGGFNAYRREVLETINLDSIRSEGYAFQIEMKFRAWKRGFRIAEMPIVFADRTRGKSKMSRRIFLEAIFTVWKMRFSSR